MRRTTKHYSRGHKRFLLLTLIALSCSTQVNIDTNNDSHNRNGSDVSSTGTLSDGNGSSIGNDVEDAAHPQHLYVDVRITNNDDIPSQQQSKHKHKHDSDIKEEKVTVVPHLRRLQEEGMQELDSLGPESMNDKSNKDSDSNEEYFENNNDVLSSTPSVTDEKKALCIDEHGETRENEDPTVAGQRCNDTSNDKFTNDELPGGPKEDSVAVDGLGVGKPKVPIDEFATKKDTHEVLSSGEDKHQANQVPSTEHQTRDNDKYDSDTIQQVNHGDTLNTSGSSSSSKETDHKGISEKTNDVIDCDIAPTHTISSNEEDNDNIEGVHYHTGDDDSFLEPMDLLQPPTSNSSLDDKNEQPEQQQQERKQPPSISNETTRSASVAMDEESQEDVMSKNEDETNTNVDTTYLAASTIDSSDATANSNINENEGNNSILPNQEENHLASPDDDHDGPVKQVIVNYAHKSAGAVILERSPTFEGTSNLLVSDNDKYALVPCSDKFKTVVIGLSEDCLVKNVILSNYERFSSQTRTFHIWGSVRFPKPEWQDLGEYEAKPGNNEQTFELNQPAWSRYLKFRFLTHHGSEHYCTMTQIKVHGSTMLEGFHEQWESEMEEEEIIRNVAAAGGAAGGPTNEIKETVSSTATAKPTSAESNRYQQQQVEGTEEENILDISDEVAGEIEKPMNEDKNTGKSSSSEAPVTRNNNDSVNQGARTRMATDTAATSMQNMDSTVPISSNDHDENRNELAGAAEIMNNQNNDHSPESDSRGGDRTITATKTNDIADDNRLVADSGATSAIDDSSSSMNSSSDSQDPKKKDQYQEQKGLSPSLAIEIEDGKSSNDGIITTDHYEDNNTKDNNSSGITDAIKDDSSAIIQNDPTNVGASDGASPPSLDQQELDQNILNSNVVDVETQVSRERDDGIADAKSGPMDIPQKMSDVIKVASTATAGAMKETIKIIKAKVTNSGGGSVTVDEALEQQLLGEKEEELLKQLIDNDPIEDKDLNAGDKGIESNALLSSDEPIILPDADTATASDIATEINEESNAKLTSITGKELNASELQQHHHHSQTSFKSSSSTRASTVEENSVSASKTTEIKKAAIASDSSNNHNILENNENDSNTNNQHDGLRKDHDKHKKSVAPEDRTAPAAGTNAASRSNVKSDDNDERLAADTKNKMNEDVTTTTHVHEQEHQKAENDTTTNFDDGTTESTNNNSQQHRTSTTSNNDNNPSNGDGHSKSHTDANQTHLKHEQHEKIASASLLKKIDERDNVHLSAALSCLERLNLQDFKTAASNMIHAATNLGGGSGVTNDNGHASNNSNSSPGSGGSGAPPSQMHQPIFKTITDEIKTLKLTQGLHDQYIKSVTQCYQEVILVMAQKMEIIEQRQEKRLTDMETEMSEMRNFLLKEEKAKRKKEEERNSAEKKRSQLQSDSKKSEAEKEHGHYLLSNLSSSMHFIRRVLDTIWEFIRNQTKHFTLKLDDTTSLYSHLIINCGAWFHGILMSQDIVDDEGKSNFRINISSSISKMFGKQMSQHLDKNELQQQEHHYCEEKEEVEGSAQQLPVVVIITFAIVTIVLLLLFVLLFLKRITCWIYSRIEQFMRGDEDEPNNIVLINSSPLSLPSSSDLIHEKNEQAPHLSQAVVKRRKKKKKKKQEERREITLTSPSPTCKSTKFKSAKTFIAEDFKNSNRRRSDSDSLTSLDSIMNIANRDEDIDANVSKGDNADTNIFESRNPAITLERAFGKKKKHNINNHRKSNHQKFSSILRGEYTHKKQ